MVSRTSSDGNQPSGNFKSGLTAPLLSGNGLSDDPVESKRSAGGAQSVGLVGTLNCYGWITDPALVQPVEGSAPSQVDSKAPSRKASFFSRLKPGNPPSNPQAIRQKQVKELIFPHFQGYLNKIFRKELVRASQSAPKVGTSKNIDPLLRVSAMTVSGFTKLDHEASVKLIKSLEDRNREWAEWARGQYEESIQNPAQKFPLEPLVAILTESLTSGSETSQMLEDIIDKELGDQKGDVVKRQAKALAIREQMVALSYAYLEQFEACKDSATFGQVQEAVIAVMTHRLTPPPSDLKK